MTASSHIVPLPPALLSFASRWLFIASLLCGLAYPALDTLLTGPAAILAKASGVALLALAAVALPGGRWLAAIMTCGALGDALLEVDGLFLAGAASFAVGHVIAMTFYSRHRAASGTGVRLGAAALIGFGLAMPGMVTPAGQPIGHLMLYSVLLCGMAAALLLSRFPRLAVAGALLFVVSDTLLIMRLGGRVLVDGTAHGAAVWLTYYVGQALIFIGVASGLARTEAKP